MSHSTSILAWLDSICNDRKLGSEPLTEPSLKHTIKQEDRKRRLPSPPSEDETRIFRVSQMDNTGPPKKPKVGPITDASDPRLRLSAPKRTRDPHDNGSDQEDGGHIPRTSESGVETGSRSARSRKKASPSRVSMSASSSPSRRLHGLSLENDGLVTRDLDIGDKRQPPLLKALLTKIDGWSTRWGILHSSMRGVFGDDVSQYGFHEDVAFSAEPNDCGSRLSLKDAEEILDRARECRDLSHSEMAWNFEVHQYLLEKIFRADDRPYLVNFSSSHSASIIKEYLPTTTGSKLVDFCIYVNPGADRNKEKDYGTQTNDLSRILPMQCLNHTSYLGLAARPISASIETKRTGDDEDNAALQIGTWQAAQWNYLESLLIRIGGEEHAETALTDLGLLPAIITHGHQWSFAATTREGGKIVGIFILQRFMDANTP
ncbi:hypothetical protein HZS61_008491 [Fusarium oxysporum f. sp. conglutinans]|uniref:PD-(D/E)XK nuclease-like domain-containing protein n=1 Tax=Fusarium oxysporum f. sp. conglutinans TaxID=100902 RepID=A0A8H6H1U7_FUSOX|nr:hypothetical protein HZS61_008491 [Fusarium oxysporum f. sp. conglutinans]KAH7465437.1 hypothetical protein FOMA001_g17056 [Fusarium oxysporum f. sp. matthiolae]